MLAAGVLVGALALAGVGIAAMVGSDPGDEDALASSDGGIEAPDPMSAPTTGSTTSTETTETTGSTVATPTTGAPSVQVGGEIPAAPAAASSPLRTPTGQISSAPPSVRQAAPPPPLTTTVVPPVQSLPVTPAASSSAPATAASSSRPPALAAAIPTTTTTSTTTTQPPRPAPPESRPAPRPAAPVAPIASTTTTTTPPPVVPAAPGPPAASPANGAATLRWSAVPAGSDVKSLTVYAEPGPIWMTIPATVTEATVSGLRNDTEYRFAMVANNDDGASPRSGMSNAVVPSSSFMAPPAAPTAVRAFPADGAVTVAFESSDANATSFVVQPSPDGQPVTVARHARLATVPGLRNGTAYTFTITARSASAMSSPSSSSNLATPAAALAAPPSAPSQVIAEAANGAVNVRWTPPTDDGGASIQRYTVTAEPGGEFITVGGRTTVATLLGLRNGSPHTVSVTAANDTAVGAPSAPTGQVVPLASLALPPPTPTSVSAVTGVRSATVSWVPPTDPTITSYVVTALPSGIAVQVPAPASMTMIWDLDPQMSHTFTVLATNPAGSSAPSEASNFVRPLAVPPPAPDAPTTTTVPPTTTTTTVTVPPTTTTTVIVPPTTTTTVTVPDTTTTSVTVPETTTTSAPVPPLDPTTTTTVVLPIGGEDDGLGGGVSGLFVIGAPALALVALARRRRSSARATDH